MSRRLLYHAFRMRGIAQCLARRESMCESSGTSEEEPAGRIRRRRDRSRNAQRPREKTPFDSLLSRGASQIVAASAGSVLARNRTWSTTFAGSRAILHTPRTGFFSQSLSVSAPPRSRTSSDSFEGCHASITPAGPVSRPGFEPGPGPSEGPMRSVTPSGLLKQRTRADDWIRASMSPFTRRVPFSVEPRRQLKIVRQLQGA
jgi:hypothetical protein